MGIFTTRKLARAAVIAALYVALTQAFAFMSFGAIQFRISEVLTILPLFCPEAIVGLVIGCFLSALFSPNTLVWELLGVLASLIAAFMTYFIGRAIKKDWRIGVGILPPILVNAFVVPFIFLAAVELKEAYFINVLLVGAGQATVLVALGIPFYFALKRFSHKIFDNLFPAHVNKAAQSIQSTGGTGQGSDTAADKVNKAPEIVKNNKKS